MEAVQYFGAYPVIYIAMIILSWQLYLWVSTSAFAVLFLLIVMSGKWCVVLYNVRLV